jgi:drug/metabolite transporter (DMT)-like permease
MVMIAAVGHALWNVAARQVAGDIAVLWLSFALGTLAMLPPCIYLWWQNGPPQLTEAALLCLLATGLLHAAYFALLAWAYETGEVSLVYPIARGSGVGLTALGGIALLGETVTPSGGTGIGLVLIGIGLIGIPALRSAQAQRRSFVLALAVGLSIVAYSLVDKIGVGHMHPIYYITGMWLLGSLIRWPSVWLRRRGTMWQTARTHYRHIAFIGLGSLGTYLIILYAYTLGPVSYIVAARESSVVIGSLIGFFFLHEKYTPLKLVGVLSIGAGLALIKVG